MAWCWHIWCTADNGGRNVWWTDRRAERHDLSVTVSVLQAQPGRHRFFSSVCL